jgi:hypothetical protein
MIAPSPLNTCLWRTSSLAKNSNNALASAFWPEQRLAVKHLAARFGLHGQIYDVGSVSWTLILPPLRIRG